MINANERKNYHFVHTVILKNLRLRRVEIREHTGDTAITKNRLVRFMAAVFNHKALSGAEQKTILELKKTNSQTFGLR